MATTKKLTITDGPGQSTFENMQEDDTSREVTFITKEEGDYVVHCRSVQVNYSVKDGIDVRIENDTCKVEYDSGKSIGTIEILK